MDHGLSSQTNRLILQQAGGQYILGKKLSGSRLNEAAVSYPGSFKKITGNLHINEVFVDGGTARQSISP